LLSKVLAESFVEYMTKVKVNPAEVDTPELALAVVRHAESDWAATPLAELDGRTPAEALAELNNPDAWREFLTTWAAQNKVDWLPAAVRPQGEAQVAAAVPAMVGLLEHLDPGTRRADAVVAALEEIGEPARAALYDLCERYQADVDSDPYTLALEVLLLMPQDNRTWWYLKQALQRSVDFAGLYGAMAGDYKDKRAVFFLNTLLEERPELSRYDQMTILESIELCGGVPTDAAIARLNPEPRLDRPAGKVGRNDPCPCGSGKKHKKCCGR